MPTRLTTAVPKLASLNIERSIAFFERLGFSKVLQGDPRVNIQNARTKAKPYQVRQVLLAIDRLERNDE